MNEEKNEQQNKPESNLADSNIQAEINTKLSEPADLLKRSWNIYKEKFVDFFKIVFLIPFLGALPFMAVLLFFYGSAFLPTSFQSILAVLNIIFGVLGFVSFLLLIFVACLSQIAVFVYIRDFGISQEFSLKSLYNKTKGLFWSYLLVNLLTGLAVMLWSLLFIVPGIIYSVYYAFSLYALLFEGYDSNSALERSKELIKGYWWPVAWRNIYILALYLLFFIFCGLLLLLVPGDTIANDILNYILQIVQSLLTPVFIIYNSFLYIELAKIKGPSRVEKKKRGIGIIIIILFFLLFIGVLSTFLTIKSRDARVNSDKIKGTYPTVNRYY